MKNLGQIHNKIYKNINNIPGIYAFKNITNNKYYIGQSINIRRRIQNHLTNCRNHLNYILYTAMNKDGWDKFELIILYEYTGDIVNKQQLKKDILDPLEEHYIKEYDTYMHGYNSTKGQDNGVIDYKHTKTSLKKISEASKQRWSDGRYTVYVFNITDNTIISFDNMKLFEQNMNLKNGHKGLVNLVFHDNYILARDKKILNKKIQKYKNLIFNGWKNGYKKEIPKNLKQYYLEHNIQDTLEFFQITMPTLYKWTKILNIRKSENPDIENDVINIYETNKNISEISKILHISRSRIYRILKKYNVEIIH